jgi:dephospho-CoA kinase
VPGPPFVGLTGGIGAGKSEALKALERLGAATLSADAVVHELYEDPELVAIVRDRWGDEVAPDGMVDRAAIARKAFASDDERKWLESELWPRVGQRMFAWKTEQEAADLPPRALVIETPLLFESGMDRGYEATIAVVADEEIRAQRAASRGHEAVDERAARQLTQQEKAARATFVVRNDGSLDELEEELSSVLEKLETS